MKKLLIGLLALGSISAFAGEVVCGNPKSISKDLNRNYLIVKFYKRIDSTSGTIVNYSVSTDLEGLVTAAQVNNRQICFENPQDPSDSFMTTKAELL